MCGVAAQVPKSLYARLYTRFDINSVCHLYWFGERSFRSGIACAAGRTVDQASYPCGTAIAFTEYH